MVFLARHKSSHIRRPRGGGDPANMRTPYVSVADEGVVVWILACLRAITHRQASAEMTKRFGRGKVIGRRLKKGLLRL